MGLFSSKSSSTQNQYTTNNSLSQGFNDAVSDAQIITGDSNSVVVTDHDSVQSAFDFAEHASTAVFDFVREAHDDVLTVMDNTQKKGTELSVYALEANERATNAALDVAANIASTANPDGSAMKYMTAVLIASAAAFAYAVKK